MSFPEALKCLRAYSLRPLPETLELGLIVNMAAKKGKLREPFRGTMLYPHRFGKERRVLLLAEVCVCGGCCACANIGVLIQLLDLNLDYHNHYS